MKLTGLEQVIQDNIEDLKDGTHWVLIGKYQSTRGFRKWEAITLLKNDPDEIRNREARLLLQDDPNCILINAHEHPWIGIDRSIKDISKNIKQAYEAGTCRTSWVQILLMMQKDIVKRVLNSTDEIVPYMPDADKLEWQKERKQIIEWLEG